MNAIDAVAVQRFAKTHLNHGAFVIAGPCRIAAALQWKTNYDLILSRQ